MTIKTFEEWETPKGLDFPFYGLAEEAYEAGVKAAMEYYESKENEDE